MIPPKSPQDPVLGAFSCPIVLSISPANSLQIRLIPGANLPAGKKHDPAAFPLKGSCSCRSIYHVKNHHFAKIPASPGHKALFCVYSAGSVHTIQDPGMYVQQDPIVRTFTADKKKTMKNINTEWRARQNSSRKDLRCSPNFRLLLEEMSQKIKFGFGYTKDESSIIREAVLDLAEKNKLISKQERKFF